MKDLALQAETLNQALPYIQMFRGQTFVVKFGGSAMNRPENVASVIRNVLLLQHVGIHPVLVHGGGPEIDQWLSKVGIEKQQIDGLRVTDDATMEVVEMVLAGKANKSLVAEIQRLGGRAVGLSGRDGGLIQAEATRPELGRVGEVREIRPSLLQTVIADGFIPVICSVGADPDGQALNINADTAAAAIAIALCAGKLILMTDTNGVLSNVEDRSSTISRLTTDETEAMIEHGSADKGMIPKLRAANAAVEGGVKRVHLINAGVPNALLIEVFTNQGIGTMVTTDRNGILG